MNREELVKAVEDAYYATDDAAWDAFVAAQDALADYDKEKNI